MVVGQPRRVRLRPALDLLGPSPVARLEEGERQQFAQRQREGGQVRVHRRAHLPSNTGFVFAAKAS